MKIIDHIISYHELTCYHCRKSKILFELPDDYIASEEFTRLGWKAGRENVYCPECAKTKLKKKIKV